MSTESSKSRPLFATYNIGNDHDFANLQHTYTTKFSEDQIKARSAAQSAANRGISTMASVIAFQEIVRSERTELSDLHNFTIFTPENYFEVGIAIDNSRFQSIENHSFITNSKIPVAFVTAFDKDTEKKYGFVSIQVSGYNLEKPNPDEKQAKAEESIEISKKIQELGQTHKCDQIIVGGDFNTNPTLSPEHFSPWRDRGFTILTPQEKTNICKNPKFAQTMKDRTLDHILVWEKPTWSNLPGRIGRFFFGGSWKATTKGPFEPKFNPAKAASDHPPGYLTKTTQPTILQRIYYAILGGTLEPAETENLQEPKDLNEREKIKMTLHPNQTKRIHDLRELGFWIDSNKLSTTFTDVEISLPAGWKTKKTNRGNSTIIQCLDEENIPRVLCRQFKNSCEPYALLNKERGTELSEQLKSKTTTKFDTLSKTSVWGTSVGVLAKDLPSNRIEIK